MLGTFPAHVVFSLDSDHPRSPSCFSLCPPMLLHSKKQIDPTPIWGRIGLEIWWGEGPGRGGYYFVAGSFTPYQPIPLLFHSSLPSTRQTTSSSHAQEGAYHDRGPEPTPETLSQRRLAPDRSLIWCTQPPARTQPLPAERERERARARTRARERESARCECVCVCVCR